MRIDWDVPIKMDDGVVLRADVYRPLGEGRYPVIMTLGPYTKGLAFQDTFYKGSWDNMVGKYPEIAEGSSNKYQNWEVVDPEKWVPDGYVCIRVDEPRRRPLAGRHGSLVAAGAQGLLRLY